MKFIVTGLLRFTRLFKILASLFAAALTTAFAFLIAVYVVFSRDLPNIQKASDYRPPVVSTLYGSDGSVIGEFWSDEKRMLTDISKIPPLLISAFLAAEDARFFEHRGIDFRGTLRAFLANLKARDIVQGGSTITQQVTRSLLLSRKRTYSRKIQEAILATRLERTLTKDQILYLYLNQIYFGNRAYGVQAAAQNYFHKNLKGLSLAETALLAALPRAPQSYSPLKYPEKARSRQVYVLDRLLEEGVITPPEREEALKAKITLYVEGTDKETNAKIAPFVSEYLRQILLEKYGPEKLYTGGLKIYTTIDPKIQQAANLAIQRGLEVVDRRTRGWRGVLAHRDPSEIDAHRKKMNQEILKNRESISFPMSPNAPGTPTETGHIYKAIVTGFEGETTRVAIGLTDGVVPQKDIAFDPNKLAYDESLYLHQPSQRLKVGDILGVRHEGENRFSFYQAPQIEGALFAMEPATGMVRAMVGGYDFKRSEFNRAMLSLRQPGSAFKPFIYAAALDKGYTLGSPIADSPFAIPVGDEVWAPKNYDGKYRGLTTVRNALVHSYNVATARIGYHIRLHYLTAYIRKLGITTPIEKYPSMTLGANGVHLHEMTAAFATFANLGVYRPPVFITKIVDSEGEVLEEYVPAPLTSPPPLENAEELNVSLYDANQEIIQKDGLNLYPSELKVLYGGNIPPGHVMTPQTAYLMVELMKGVVESGTGFRVKRLGKPVAGKTGTTNDESDTWFVGFTPQLACGVWVGYDQVRKIGLGEQGGRTAAPIFLDFMQTATAQWEPKAFAMPPELQGKNLLALAGGSAPFAEYVPMSALGLIEGGSSEDRAADFFEADMEGRSEGVLPPLPEEEGIQEEF